MRSFRWWLITALTVGVPACSSDGGSPSDTDPSGSEDDDGSNDDDGDDEPARDAASSPQSPRDAGNTGRDASAAQPNLDAASARDSAAPARDAASSAIDATTDPASDAQSAAADASSAAFALTSSAVQEGGTIPGMYRCMAPSPPLSWTAGPTGTESYAILFQDEANMYYHWVLYDIPKSTTSLAMGVPAGAMPAMPMGAKQGPIYNRSLGYAGPCFPTGGPRPYAFTLYALSTATLPGVTETTNAMQVFAALERFVLAKAKLSIRSVP